MQLEGGKGAARQVQGTLCRFKFQDQRSFQDWLKGRKSKAKLTANPFFNQYY